MELELLLQRLCMEGTDGGVVAHLLRNQSVSFLLSWKKQYIKQINTQMRSTHIVSNRVFPTLVRYPIPHHLVCFSQQRVEWLSSSFPLRCNSRDSKCSNELSTHREVIKIMTRCLSCFTHRHNYKHNKQNTNTGYPPACGLSSQTYCRLCG